MSMTDSLEVLIYFNAACIGIYTMKNIVHWFNKGTKNLPAPVANVIKVRIFSLIIVMLP